MADVALVAGGSKATPLDYTIPGAQEIVIKAATANYDGSGAGAPYVPTLLIKSPAGAVLAACPIGSTIAAGASADVSWFPGLSPGVPSTGIYFGINNVGSWLDITTTGTDPFGNGITIGGNRVEIDSDLFVNAAFTVITSGENIELFTDEWLIMNSDFVELVAANPPSWETTTHSPGVIRIGDQNNDVQIGDDRTGAGAATCEVNVGVLQLGNNNSTKVEANGALFYAFTNTVTVGHVSSTVQIGGNTTILNTAAIGFYGVTPVTRQTVTGSRGGNAALASLLTALATAGLIVDGSSP